MYEGFRRFDIRTSDPEVTIRGVVGRFRDKKDLEASHRIACPVLVIVGGQSHTAKFYGYEKGWATYVENLVGCVALPCGHYPAEQAPDETHAELGRFFGSKDGSQS